MNSLPASHFALTAVFVLCLLTLGIGALIAVMSTRLIRSVCGLAICCIGLAGLYYFLHSPFLALMEILIQCIEDMNLPSIEPSPHAVITSGY